MTIFKRVFSFFRNVIKEMRKVSWLSKHELLVQTSTVLIFVVFMTVYFGLADYIISLVRGEIDKLFYLN